MILDFRDFQKSLSKYACSLKNCLLYVKAYNAKVSIQSLPRQRGVGSGRLFRNFCRFNNLKGGK